MRAALMLVHQELKSLGGEEGGERKEEGRRKGNEEGRGRERGRGRGRRRENLFDDIIQGKLRNPRIGGFVRRSYRHVLSFRRGSSGMGPSISGTLAGGYVPSS
jgi:hypothetical protein